MRILHTMLRVTDLDKSIVFYSSILNMKLINHKGYPRDAGPMKHGNIILAFVKDPDGYLIDLLTDKGTMS